MADITGGDTVIVEGVGEVPMKATMPVVETTVTNPLQDRSVADVGTITTRMAAAQPVEKNAKHVVAEDTSRVCAADMVQPGKMRSNTNIVQAQTSMIQRSSIILAQ